VTDRDLIGKKLAHIETSVQELRTFARPSAIRDDLRAFVAAIQQRLEAR
jgi:hypothetical protein